MLCLSRVTFSPEKQEKASLELKPLCRITILRGACMSVSNSIQMSNSVRECGLLNKILEKYARGQVEHEQWKLIRDYSFPVSDGVCTSVDNYEFFKTRRSIPFNIHASVRQSLTTGFLREFSIPWVLLSLPQSCYVGAKYVHGSSVRFFTVILLREPASLSFQNFSYQVFEARVYCKW